MPKEAAIFLVAAAFMAVWVPYKIFDYFIRFLNWQEERRAKKWQSEQWWYQSIQERKADEAQWWADLVKRSNSQASGLGLEATTSPTAVAARHESAPV